MDPKLIIQKLALIRYLYNNAVNQSRQPEPMGATSILTFHDSVELFLGLACEHFDVGKSSMNFMDYWEAINPKLEPGSLGQKKSMQRMNKSRVNLKHHGTLPSRMDIESFRANTTSFFEDNTPLVFKYNFADISMVDLVECDEAKSTLEEAKRLLDEGRMEDAFVKVAIAFDQLICHYVDKKWTLWGRPLISFGESVRLAFDFPTRSQDRPLRDFADSVASSIDTMQRAMKILSLGLDFRRYVKFKHLIPTVLLTDGGTVIVQDLGGREPESIEGYRFCYDFVVEAAIHLQEFDLEINV